MKKIIKSRKITLIIISVIAFLMFFIFSVWDLWDYDYFEYEGEFHLYLIALVGVAVVSSGVNCIIEILVELYNQNAYKNKLLENLLNNNGQQENTVFKKPTIINAPSINENNKTLVSPKKDNIKATSAQQTNKVVIPKEKTINYDDKKQFNNVSSSTKGTYKLSPTEKYVKEHDPEYYEQIKNDYSHDEDLFTEYINERYNLLKKVFGIIDNNILK